MSSKFSILHYTTDHFNNSKYVDATLVPFDKDFEVAYIYLTSKTIDLQKVEFKFKLNFENWKDRHFLSNDKLWPVFSNKLVEIIKKHYSTLVYFPVTLIDKKGKEHSNNFSVVQIPDAEGIINYDLSIFERDNLFPEIFSSIEKIVFNPEIISNAIFRLHEYSQVILINNELRNDLIQEKLANITITDAADYDWSYL
ncbi:MAG: hypothetical protein ABI850_10120 [Flavobacterium sp.]